ncbi:hypothetical protein ABWH89_18775 [Hoeflea alexandrii]|uniref:hypothetical protein n=1 Tax=Hoeflea alexandrii TaxID=288436 RepID=UPI0035CEB558
MVKALNAAAAYFCATFAAGFVLGTIRTLLVEPTTGALGAVALELPLMLAVSWIACGWALRRFDLESRFSPRLVMGVVALALLMGAELFVSVLLAGRSPGEHLALYQTVPALLGLAAQLAYAIFPLVRLR